MHFKNGILKRFPVPCNVSTYCSIELFGSEPFKFALFVFLQTPSLCVATYNLLKFHNLKFLETYLATIINSHV